MRVRDVVQTLPVFCAEEPALAAVRHVAHQNVAGLAVVRHRSQSPVLLNRLDLLALMLPRYLHASQSLARTLDEPHADLVADYLAGVSLADAIRWHDIDNPAVPAEATLVEPAALMTRFRRSVLAVHGMPPNDDRREVRIVTAEAVLRALSRTDVEVTG
jgi:hypothetical protein